MKVRFVLTTVVLGTVRALAGAPSSEDQSSHPAAVALCSIRTVGDQYVGRSVAITGALDQNVEFTTLWDSRCPGAAVLLRFAEGTPYPDECFDNPATPRCGGINRDSQVIVVVGTLVTAPHLLKTKRKGPLWSNAIVEVNRYEAAAHSGAGHDT